MGSEELVYISFGLLTFDRNGKGPSVRGLLF